MNKSTATLKSILASRGLRYADLAADTGLALGTIQNVACGSSPSRRARLKIEQALGIQLWEKPADKPGQQSSLADGRAGNANFAINKS